MTTTLDAPVVAAALRVMLAVVREHEAELDQLNVFPVPDGDTGANLAGTLDGMVAALDARGHGSLSAVAEAVAAGGLEHARGSSGLILAEALRGLCEAWAGLDRVGPADLARGFRAASDAARAAVLDPVEGTVLTVARAVAEALEAAPGGDLPALLRLATEAAARAVAATREQLGVLREAGVVDAGGRGWQLCVAALAAVAAGVPLPRPELAPAAGKPAPAATRPGPARPGPAFEVEYLLDCSPGQAASLQAALGRIGESVVLTGEDGRYRVHVHTDQAGAAVEEGLRRGVPAAIRITWLGPPRFP